MDEPVFDVDDLVALGRVHAHALSPDGTWVAVEVRALDEDGAAYIGSIYKLPLDGGPVELLLGGAFDDKSPAFWRDGALTFLSNRTDEAFSDAHEPDDKAKVQVWARHPDSSLERLTDEPLGVSSHQPARRADVLVVQAPVLPEVEHGDQRAVAEDLEKGPSVLRYTEMPVRFWDHWLPRTSPHLIAYVDGMRRDLTPDRTDRVTDRTWVLSEDGTSIVYTERVAARDRLDAFRLVHIDLASAEATVLTPDASASFGQPVLSPDGATVVARRSFLVRGRAWEPELVRIPLADPVSGLQVLAADWDVHPSPVGMSRDGTTVFVTASVRGRVPLFAVDVGSGERRRLTEGGSIHGVAVGDDVLILRRSTFLRPPHLLALSLDDGGLRELADLSDMPVDLAEHLQVEDIEVEGHGGDPVQGFVVSPRGGASRGGLLWIHGGPIGDWADGWHWRWSAALAASQGFAVGCPNPRGSVGFGQDFVQGIWGNRWGEACATDVLAFADALDARDDVDGTVCMGGSFGGYMTNWLATRTDRFTAAVTHASLFDLRAFHGVTDLPAFWADQFLLDPWTDDEALERYNPRAHLDGWSTRTLILHGEKDYRVPIGEALALFEGLQARGVESELVVFPDENHWILKPRNIVAWYEAWLGFIERTVGREDGNG